MTPYGVDVSIVVVSEDGTLQEGIWGNFPIAERGICHLRGEINSRRACGGPYYLSESGQQKSSTTNDKFTQWP